MKNQRAGNPPDVPFGDPPFIPITGYEIIPPGDLDEGDIPLLCPRIVVFFIITSLSAMNAINPKPKMAMKQMMAMTTANPNLDFTVCLSLPNSIVLPFSRQWVWVQ
jgi:hypothetical protein